MDSKDGVGGWQVRVCLYNKNEERDLKPNLSAYLQGVGFVVCFLTCWAMHISIFITFNVDFLASNGLHNTFRLIASPSLVQLRHGHLSGWLHKGSDDVVSTDVDR